MKSTITVLLLLAFSSQLFAQEATTETTSPAIETKRSANKRYLGLSLGNHLGGVGVGAKYGQFLNNDNLAEVSLLQWKESEGNTNNSKYSILTNGKGISISNKYFVWHSLNLGAGVFYRQIDFVLPTNMKLIQNGQIVTNRRMEDIGAAITIGNHWFGEEWVFNVDWISYIPSIAKVKEVPGIKLEGDLVFLNLTVGRSF